MKRILVLLFYFTMLFGLTMSVQAQTPEELSCEATTALVRDLWVSEPTPEVLGFYCAMAAQGWTEDQIRNHINGPSSVGLTGPDSYYYISRDPHILVFRIFDNRNCQNVGNISVSAEQNGVILEENGTHGEERFIYPSQELPCGGGTIFLFMEPIHEQVGRPETELKHYTGLVTLEYSRRVVKPHLKDWYGAVPRKGWVWEKFSFTIPEAYRQGGRLELLVSDDSPMVILGQ